MSPSKISWEDISPKEGLRSAAQQPKPHPQPFPLFLVGSKMQPLLALCSPIFNSPAIVLDPATSSGSKSALFLIRNTELSAP